MSSNTFTLGTKSVNRLGYGAMQLAGPGVFGPPRDRHVAITVLREALALGVNHIDTSDFYGPHVTNQIIREALYPYSDDLTIVTKIGARRGEDASWLPAFSPAELQKAVQGSSLDYVYQNQPQGSNAFGRLIDKIYLNSVGWRGIRQRKTHLQILIKQAVADLHAKGLAVRVVDIAAGHGRYVLDALANEPAVSDILLRDYSELNVAQGQEMIAQRGMSGRVRFEQGDAFNPEELSALTPRPTLAIVSGLYELFPENEQVKNSLAGLANAIEPGGILLYTGQPWHPQLELIAGVLTSHKDGKPWVMRVRSQGEMDSLVRNAGFDKCTQRIDEWGIFTVSMAVRRDN